LPREVDWRSKNVVTNIKHQGHCRSCWALTPTAAVESAFAIQSGLKIDFAS
jgi:C1A family cysteine protease